MTPSPALPLKEKGVQPHLPLLRQVCWRSLSRLTEELEGVFDNDHFEHIYESLLNSYSILLKYECE
jgi:hypothetical protein